MRLLQAPEYDGQWVQRHGNDFAASASTAAPTITAQPVNQTVTAGQTAGFTVVATGAAPLSYQWQKNGVNIAGLRRPAIPLPRR